MNSNPPAPPEQSGDRRMNFIKLGLGCTGIGMIFVTGLIILVIIVMPVVFRALLPGDQYWVVKHFPIATLLQATEPFVALPTSAATSGNALALLASPMSGGPTLMPVVNGGGLSSGVSDTGDSGTIVPSPTPLPPTRTPLPTATVPPVSGSSGSPTPVVALTATPLLPTYTPSVIPSATLPPVPPDVHLSGFKWVPQGWNNCGPANLTQALNFYGWQGSQDTAAGWLKPNREDKNVSPWQMIEFVRTHTNLKAIQRVGGDLTLIKRLVSDKFAVIMETGYNVAGEGWMGHYLTVEGYDDNLSTLYGLDTWLGTGPDHLGFREDYDDLDSRWQAFNRLYLVIYQPERESDLAALLGPDADLHYNAYHALSVARTEASAHPDNPFTWFNIGSSYVLLQQYKDAVTFFDQAWNVGGLPPRMLWYQFTPYEAYYNIGNYTNVLALVQTALTSTPYVEETFYWRGMAEAAQGRTQSAIEDFKRVLAFNPNFSPAQDRIQEVQNGKFSAPVVAQAGQ